MRLLFKWDFVGFVLFLNFLSVAPAKLFVLFSFFTISFSYAHCPAPYLVHFIVSQSSLASRYFVKWCCIGRKPVVYLCLLVLNFKHLLPPFNRQNFVKSLIALVAISFTYHNWPYYIQDGCIPAIPLFLKASRHSLESFKPRYGDSVDVTGFQ